MRWKLNAMICNLNNYFFVCAFLFVDFSRSPLSFRFATSTKWIEHSAAVESFVTHSHHFVCTRKIYFEEFFYLFPSERYMVFICMFFFCLCLTLAVSFRFFFILFFFYYFWHKTRLSLFSFLVFVICLRPVRSHKFALCLVLSLSYTLRWQMHDSFVLFNGINDIDYCFCLSNRHTREFRFFFLLLSLGFTRLDFYLLSVFGVCENRKISFALAMLMAISSSGSGTKLMVNLRNEYSNENGRCFNVDVRTIATRARI